MSKKKKKKKKKKHEKWDIPTSTSPRTSTIVQFIFYFGPLRSAIIF